MNHHDIDEIFTLLENRTRRRILRLLSMETHYPLQIARELGISQQGVGKHLKVLEEHGLIRSREEPSQLGGPPRKSYLPTERISIRVDLGPGYFRTFYFERKPPVESTERDPPEKNRDLGNESEPRGGSEPGDESESRGGSDQGIESEPRDCGESGDESEPSGGSDPGDENESTDRIESGVESESGQKGRSEVTHYHTRTRERARKDKNDIRSLKSIASELKQLGNEQEELEVKRINIINRREELLQEGRKIVMSNIPDYLERKLIYYLLDRGPTPLEDISEIFDRRIKQLRELQQGIEEQYGLDWLFFT